jgi:hypothetical protein
MPSAVEAPVNDKTTAGKPAQGKRGARRRGGRRSHDQATANIRYFVGRPADADGKPTLDQEVASEPEALVIAFKNDSRAYLVNEYRVTQRIEGGQVRLEKEAATSAIRYVLLPMSQAGLAVRFGLPVLPEWAERFCAELHRRGSSRN